MINAFPSNMQVDIIQFNTSIYKYFIKLSIIIKLMCIITNNIENRYSSHDSKLK